MDRGRVCYVAGGDDGEDSKEIGWETAINGSETIETVKRTIKII